MRYTMDIKGTGQPVAPPALQKQQARNKEPSLAQFAINQMVNKSKQQSPELTVRKEQQAILETGTKSEVAITPRSLSIFKDSDSGKFVSIFRDLSTGKVIEQIPDDKLLAFYSRLEKELGTFGKIPAAEIQELSQDIVPLDIKT